jgi:hypothetical protein
MLNWVQLVNQVLIRLRESQVTTVSATSYSQLIGAYVNDAKRIVENAWQWSGLIDYYAFNTVTGQSQYHTNANSGAILGTAFSERTRLYIDTVENKPLLINATLNFEARLNYKPTLVDRVTYQMMLNQPTLYYQPPTTWTLYSDPTNTAYQWNKIVTLTPFPDIVYQMQLWVVNPQSDLLEDTTAMIVPDPPVYELAYLYALYEKGEALGETIDVAKARADAALADAVSYDAQQTAEFPALAIPYGAAY